MLERLEWVRREQLRRAAVAVSTFCPVDTVTLRQMDGGQWIRFADALEELRVELYGRED